MSSKLHLGCSAKSHDSSLSHTAVAAASARTELVLTVFSAASEKPLAKDLSCSAFQLALSIGPLKIGILSLVMMSLRAS